MARKPKAEVIAELRAKGVEFDENAKYGVLWKLLKTTKENKQITAMLISTAETVGLTQAEIIACEDADALVTAINNVADKKLTPLKKRARKIGMSDAMIASYPDALALKRACDKISPKTNPDFRAQPGKVPEPVVYDKMPDKFEIDSKLECKFISQNRAQFDEANLQAELRRINRKYGPQKPVRTVRTMSFKAVKGIDEKTKLSVKFFVTHYEIFMK